MKFFGYLLKGQDFDYDKDEALIRTSDLYMTVASIPELVDPKEGLREGDILDFVNEFEQYKDGLIKLSLIKSRLDQYINDPTYHLQLRSRVK